MNTLYTISTKRNKRNHNLLQSYRALQRIVKVQGMKIQVVKYYTMQMKAYNNKMITLTASHELASLRKGSTENEAISELTKQVGWQE